MVREHPDYDGDIYEEFGEPEYGGDIHQVYDVDRGKNLRWLWDSEY